MPIAGPVRRGGRKPRDLGSGLVSASLTAGGRRWLSLACPHPDAGYVELTGLPPFDERQRGDPAAVRAYRALMADPASAFLIIEAVGATRLEARLRRPARNDDTVVQRLRVRAADDGGRAGVRLRFRGRLDLPALAMITEPTHRAVSRPVESRLLADGRRLRVIATTLTTEAVIEVSGDAAAEWRRDDDAGAACDVWLPDGAASGHIEVSCRLLAPPGTAGRRRPAGWPRTAPSDASPPVRSSVPPELQPALERIRQSALRYVRECTALTVAPRRVAILTDHRLLPLSWTRDAYWQALLLLGHGETETVADHLRWLWLDCDRPDGTWARSHHADGRRHDDIYQADQQLYPLLELADYHRQTGALPELPPEAAIDWRSLVRAVLADVARRLEPHGLVATDENAADDPVALPYLLANQLLAWHALDRMATVPDLAGLEPAPAGLAGRIAEAVGRHFVVDGPARRPLWAYSVDGRGGALLYHDANDVPTALAPLFGFCSADDATWQATMEFAFSAANPAYVGGRWPGLGSRHTAGVWSLGLVQEWIARSLTGRQAEAADALRRLIACAMDDWSLPEASDADTGRIAARHWFAWPGALAGALSTGD